MSMYRLNCFVNGERLPYNVFTVDIPINKSIFDLKEAIKKKKQPAFNNVEADKLVLKKVEVSLLEVVIVGSFNDPQTTFEKDITTITIHNPTFSIDKIWPKEPKRHHLHVVIELQANHVKRSREENEDTTSSISKKPKISDIPLEPPAHQERQYLDLVRNIIDHGQQRKDRTGTGTLSVFAPNQLRFDLSNDTFPLLTTKRINFRAVAEELLWFVSGNTNAKHLNDKGVKIWNKNGSREYLDHIGLNHRKEGDLGPVYGFQWRHFCAEYIDCETDYKGQGIDQLKDVIHKIKTNPTDRRIIMSSWNPKDLPLMALPPCHMFCQFYVSTPTLSEPKSRLSCLLYQRSCDMGLGVPYNIASYALLTRMIAHVTGLKPGDLIHTMGDAHVYNNHIKALMVQLERNPRPFPKLKFKRDVHDIDDFRFQDFVLEGYNPCDGIKMEMSV